MEIKNESLGAQLNSMAGVAPDKGAYADPKKMDKEQFLKMFMEQLKYQDPMNPVKNEQFSQQMAMFSQLEQQVNMNKNIEKLIATQSNTQIAALQLVGKNISADRATIYHDKEKPSAFQFKAPQDLNEVTLEIKDINGETVRTLNLGSRATGDVQGKWDGLDDTGKPMPTGRYAYSIKGKGMDGKDVTVQTKVEGRVTGVTSSSGVVFLLVGDQRIGLNDVETIKEGIASEPGNNPSTSDKKTAGTDPASTSGEGSRSQDAGAKASESSTDEKSPGPQIDVAGEVAAELAKASSNESADSDASDYPLHPLLPMMYR